MIQDRDCGDENDFVASASLNGKLFLAYVSTRDRLHICEPKVPRVRRLRDPDEIYLEGPNGEIQKVK